MKPIIAVYEVDLEAAQSGLDHEGRQKLRQEKSKPLMEDLLNFLETIDVPPRSSLGTAVNYILSRWSGLTEFLEDGAIPLDNNPIEALFKDIKLGMKNMLFVQSDLGGDALAGFYSIIATCELHGVNPSTYITDILEKLSEDWPASRLEELLPWNWNETSTTEKSQAQTETRFTPKSTEKSQSGTEPKTRISEIPDAIETAKRLRITKKIKLVQNLMPIPPPSDKVSNE